MSRRPAITSLLNGQAVKCRLASTSTTSMRGSARRRKRAAVAPPKPPPTTTTRGAVCARATNGAAEGRRMQDRGGCSAPAPRPPPARGGGAGVLPLPLREGVGGGGAPSLLRRPPHRDRQLLVVRKPLGDPIHHRRRPRAGAERIQRNHDLRRHRGPSAPAAAPPRRDSPNNSMRPGGARRGAPSITASTATPRSLMRALRSCRLQRQRADALAGRGEDRVQHRGTGHRDGRLADAAPEPAGRHDHRLHLRHLGDAASPDRCRSCSPPRGPSSMVISPYSTALRP